jgi:hypothetical protein
MAARYSPSGLNSAFGLFCKEFSLAVGFGRFGNDNFLCRLATRFNGLFSALAREPDVSSVNGRAPEDGLRGEEECSLGNVERMAWRSSWGFQ